MKGRRNDKVVRERVFAESRLAPLRHGYVRLLVRRQRQGRARGQEGYVEDPERRLARLLDALTDKREAANGAFESYVSRTTRRASAVIRVLTMVSTAPFTPSMLISPFGPTAQGLSTNKPTRFAIMLACVVAIRR